VAFYIQHLRHLGIPVLPPDINKSSDRFNVDHSGEKTAVRFGMGAVKNVGRSSIHAIMREVAKNGPFRDFFDFADRVPTEVINKRAVECLIKAGAFDSLPGNRAQKLAVFESAMDGAAKRRRNTVEGQISLFGDLLGDMGLDVPPPPLPRAAELPLRARLAMEKEMTGVYITGHPLDEYREELAGLEINAQFLGSLDEEFEDHGLSLDGNSAIMAGIVIEKKTKSTRKGDMMAFVTLEDLYGATEMLIFPRVYEKYRTLLEPDSLISIYGRLSVREDEPPKLIAEAVIPLTKTALSTDAFREEIRPRRTWNSDAPRTRRSTEFVPPMDELPPPAEEVYAPAPAVQVVPLPAAPAANEKTARRHADARSAAPAQSPAAKLYLKVADEAQRDRCLPILQRTRGKIPVTFYITSAGAAFRAPESYWVNDMVNLNALKRLLGEKNVVMK